MSIHEWYPLTCEVEPDFLEYVRREACEQGELPWDA